MKITAFAAGPAPASTSGGGGGGGSPGGPPGGDLGGPNYPAPKVTGIQGRPVCEDAPTTDDVLTWDGTQWCGAPIPPPAVEVLDEGGSLTATVASLDFVGAGVTATVIGDAVTVTISGGGGGTAYAQNQTQQAGRYLMRDGTWRDPLLVGDGTLTVGAITTITDDTKYNAWPSNCRMRDGRLFLLYTKGDTHHGDNTGKAVGKIGVEELDETITWGSEFTVYDHASQWTSAVGISSLASGRLIATCFINSFGSNPLDGAVLVYSDDFGATWSAPVTVNSSLTLYSYMASQALQLRDGSLRVLVEGMNTSDTYSRMRILTSTDEGATWGGEVEIVTGTRNYYEGIPTLLDDDSILVLLRTTNLDGDIYQARSTDGGATWSAPTLAFAGHARPHTIQLSTGTLITITRENGGGGAIGDVWAWTSIDRGTTWVGPVTLDGTMYEMEYGCPVELFDGRVLVNYGFQPSSSTSNADIKQVYLTEATTTIGTPSFATPAIVLGTAGAAGVAPTVIRSDATIVAFDATVPRTEAFGDSAATGSVAVAARRDHLHGMPSVASVLDAVGPQHVHVDNLTFSGDGATTDFELPASPVDAYSVAAYVAGLRVAITLSGTLLTTCTFAVAPASGTDNVIVDIAAAVA